MHIRLSEACARRARRQMSTNPDRKKFRAIGWVCGETVLAQMRKFLTADYADERRFFRKGEPDATPTGSCKNVGRIVPGVCDPGL